MKSMKRTLLKITIFSYSLVLAFPNNTFGMKATERATFESTKARISQQENGLEKWWQEPDYVKAARENGIDGRNDGTDDPVHRPFQPVVGQHLIDLAVDYSLNYSILSEGLKQKICIL